MTKQTPGEALLGTLATQANVAVAATGDAAFGAAVRAAVKRREAAFQAIHDWCVENGYEAALEENGYEAALEGAVVDSPAWPEYEAAEKALRALLEPDPA